MTWRVSLPNFYSPLLLICSGDPYDDGYDDPHDDYDDHDDHYGPHDDHDTKPALVIVMMMIIIIMIALMPSLTLRVSLPNV